MDFPHGETVVILRAGPPTLDRNGNEIPGEDVEIPVEHCGVAPASSFEPDEYGRTAVITGLQVFMPAGTDVRATDRLRVRGVVRNVEGEPFDFVSPLTGWAAGVVVNVEGVTG